MQSMTFVIGIKGLLLTVAVLYLAALITRPSRIRSGVPPSSDDDTAELSHDYPADETLEEELHAVG